MKNIQENKKEISSRELAIDILMEIMKDEGGYNSLVLRHHLSKPENKDVNKNLITEIVNGTLRNIIYIDYVINKFSIKTPVNKIKPFILSVLRCTIYQMYFMNTPNYASVHEGVKLVEKRGFSNLKAFTNAILRNIESNQNNIELPPKETSQYLSVLYSHPEWIVKMWIAYYGYENTKEICKVNNTPPKITIRCNTTKITPEELEENLKLEGVVVEKSKILENYLHLKSTSNIANLQAFQNGLFHVQDISSGIAVELLDPKPNEKVLDVCSAPGGKSFSICENMLNQGEVVACDIYDHKLELITKGCQRLGFDSNIITVKKQDATLYDENFSDYFDKILVDAPCSGLGLLRKKPDIRIKKTGDEIDELIKIQRLVLENARKYVKINGVIVYSTCTLCKKENEKNIEWFLNKFPEFECVNIENTISKYISLTGSESNGYTTLLPNVTNTDGFFIAKLIRRR